MLSNLCELIGMAGITAGTWIGAGKAAGLVVGGACALVVGLAADGVKLPKLRKPQGKRQPS
jgi:hypothetical protein